MDRIYAVSAVIRRPAPEGGYIVVQVPTFYLFADVQGIVDADHARRIATRMLEDINPSAVVNVCAVETSAAAHPA